MPDSLIMVAGLGNPGQQYSETRHNAGFLFVDRLISRYSGSLRSASKFSGDAGEVNISGQRVFCLKPTTFMNRSGQSVGAMANFYKASPQQILVVHDELDLSPGVARLKKTGGHGGHNGLRDIISHISSKDFLRLRIGIGHPGNSKEVSNFVLKRAPKSEQILIDEAIDAALDVFPLILEGNIEKAMHQLHSK